MGGWMACVILLTPLFIQPLTRLVFWATHGDLHSHILLVSLVAGYLFYIQRWSFSAV